jgi:hypothetical protein
MNTASPFKSALNAVLTISFAAMLCSSVLANDTDTAESNLSLSFQEPEKFTDIRPVRESRERFQERTLAGFQRIFAELASELPIGFHWQVMVVDIDLAGDVVPLFQPGMQEIRQVRDIYPPRIEFTHTLRDGNGQIVLEADVNITDLGFLQRPPRAAFRHRDLRYEYNLIKRWFEREVMREIDRLEPMP